MAFVHYTVKKIVHGLGAIKEAANEVKNLKGSKAFIVTDPGLAKIGVQKPLEEALTAGGIDNGSGICTFFAFSKGRAIPPLITRNRGRDPQEHAVARASIPSSPHPATRRPHRSPAVASRD